MRQPHVRSASDTIRYGRMVAMAPANVVGAIAVAAVGRPGTDIMVADLVS